MRILLAVSGGIDSMYMLNMASGLFPGASFAVAHCNFCLRGEESDEDERFVCKKSEEKGLECFTKRFDTEGHAAGCGISIEMAARELRYRWFSELCREHHFDAIAVAHNASDNAETLLLNLVRGTGTKGLRGMAEKSIREDGTVVLRPMLSLSRARIQEKMEAEGWEWREDHTNSETIYKRNIIRHEVIPVLERLNPSVLKTFSEDMERIAQVDEIARSYFEECGISAEADEIDLTALTSLKHWRYVLYRVLSSRGFPEGQISGMQNAIEAFLSKAEPLGGKRFGPAVCTNSKIILKEESGCAPFKVEVVDRSSILELKQPEGVVIMDADKLGALCGLSVDALGEHLPVRAWRDGDWMRPLGARGRKKLSDMFVDLKWDILRKKTAMVVPCSKEDDHSHVAALLFCRIDESVKIDDRTSRVIRISKL